MCYISVLEEMFYVIKSPVIGLPALVSSKDYLIMRYNRITYFFWFNITQMIVDEIFKRNYLEINLVVVKFIAKKQESDMNF